MQYLVKQVFYHQLDHWSGKSAVRILKCGLQKIYHLIRERSRHMTLKSCHVVRVK